MNKEAAAEIRKVAYRVLEGVKNLTPRPPRPDPTPPRPAPPAKPVQLPPWFKRRFGGPEVQPKPVQDTRKKKDK